VIEGAKGNTMNTMNAINPKNAINMKKIMATICAVIAASLLACAGPMIQSETRFLQRDAQAELFFSRLDKTIGNYGVFDASGFLVEGFPYMRSNRFLAGMKTHLHTDPDGLYWAEKMMKQGLQSRRKELNNLPEAAFEKLSEATGEILDRQTTIRKAEQYAQRMFREEQVQPGFIPALKRAVRVPDEYSTLARVFGLYPLAGIPVTIGTAVAYSRYEDWHQTAPDELEVLGALARYVPPKTDASVDPAFIKQLYDPDRLDAFGLPQLAPADMRQLAGLFAPVILQDVAESYDRVGQIMWQENQVSVDSENPTVYYYTSHSFLAGQPVLQLNYAFWYSERSGENAPRIEHGPLDGVTYRVTLGRDGEPVMVDIMNTCGCYYFFAPKKEIIAKIVSKPGEIAPLVPTWIPMGYPQKRMLLRVNSGWHQVQRILTDDGSQAGIPYSLAPYVVLESLPKVDGQMESVFTPAGIMKDSWRIEPYIFFSMGIANIGYMRQRGHHAIKMVGRGHFTDPDLFDRSFQFQPQTSQP
jgi:hypothetical protein